MLYEVITETESADIVETGTVSDRSVAAGLVQIQTADANFDPGTFLNGAKGAFSYNFV